MSVVGTLSVDFQANLARFIQDTATANRSLSAVGGPETQQNITSTREKIGTLCDQLTGLKNGAEATVTAFAGFKLLVEPLANITSGAIETADSIANLSERTGISVQTLSQWRYGAAQSNTTLEALTDGTKKLSKMMFEANAGNKEAAATFEALGISVKDMNVERVTGELADLTKALPTEARQGFLESVKKGLSDLLPWLNQGSDGIRKMNEEASRMKLVIPDDVASNAKQFQDNLEALKMAGQATAISMAGKFLPALVQITDAMKEGRAEGGKYGAIFSGVDAGLRIMEEHGVTGANSLRSMNGFIAEHTEEIKTLGKVYLGLKATEVIRGMALAQVDAAQKFAAGTAATMADSAAKVSAAEVVVAHTAAIRAHSAMLLADAEAAAANAAGMARLAAEESILIPARARLAAATATATAAEMELAAAKRAGSVATQLASGAVAALGGPLGVAITLLGVGATAWALFGNSAQSAGDKAKQASQDSAKAIEEAIKRTNDSRLQVAGGQFAPQIAAENKEIEKLLAERAEIRRVGYTADHWNPNTEKFKSQTLDEEIAKRKANLSQLKTLSDQLEKEQAETAAKSQSKLKSLNDSLAARNAKDGAAGADSYLNKYNQLADAVNKYEAQLKTEIDQEKKVTEGDKLQTEAKRLLTAADYALLDPVLKRIAADERRVAQDALVKKGAEELIASDKKSLEQLQQQIIQQQNEYEAIGLTKIQLDDLKSSRDLATAAEKDAEAQVFRTASAYAGPLADAYQQHVNALVLEAQKLRELADIQSRSAIKQAADDIARNAARSFDQLYTGIEQGISAGLAKGGKDGLSNLGDTLTSWLRTMSVQMILRPIVQPIYAGMASMMGVDMTKAGGTWASPGGINASGSLLNTGSNLYSMFNGSSVGSGMYGTFAASSVGQSLGLSNAASFIGPQLEGVASGAAAAEVGLTTLGSTIGAAIPYVAAAVAIYSMFSGPGGGPKSGGGSGASIVDGRYVDMGRGEKAYTPSDSDAQLKTITTALSTDYLRYSAQLGGIAANTKMSIGYDTDPNGTAPNRISALVKDKNGNTVFNETDHDVGRDSANLQTQLALETKKMMLAALQASDMPKAVAAVLSTVDAISATSAQIDNVLALAQTFKDLGTILPQMASMSSDDVKKLAGSVGDQFTTQVAAYYQTYYSQTERDLAGLATAQSQVSDTFNKLGYAIPASDEEFKKLVGTIELAGEAGAKSLNSLMQIAPTFDVIQKATTALLNNAVAAYISYQSAVGNAGAGLAASSGMAAVNDGKSQDKLAAAFGIDRATLDRAITQAGGNLADIAAKYWSQMTDAQRAAMTEAMTSKTAYISAVKAQFDEQLKIVQGYYASVKKLSDFGTGIDASIAQVKIAAGLLTSADYNAQQTAKATAALAALGPDANIDDKLALATQLRDLALERWNIELDSQTKAKQFASSLGDYLKSLKVSDNSPLDLQSKLAEAARQYADTLAAAKTGDATAESALTGKADTWLALSKQWGMGEWSSVYQKVQDGLTPMADMLPIDQQSLATQKTTAERAADTVAQLQALKGQASGWQEAEQGLLNSAIAGLQPLSGILNQLGAGGAIASAINALPEALANLINGVATQKVVNTPRSVYAASGADPASIAAFNALTPPDATSPLAGRLAADKAVAETLAGNGSFDAIKNALASGVSISDMTRSVNQAVGGWGDEQAMIEWAHSAGVPGYATGGQHSGGWRLVGENGPEIEYTGPSRIFNAGDTRNMLAGRADNSELIAELRALRAEVARLREETENGKNAELQQRAAAVAEQIARLEVIARATQDSARSTRLEGALQ